MNIIGAILILIGGVMMIIGVRGTQAAVWTSLTKG